MSSRLRTSSSSDRPVLSSWLREISEHSTLSDKVKFFALSKDPHLSHGIAVDRQGGFGSSIGGIPDITYPYLSYKVERGNYYIVGLDDLEVCLRKLNSEYRSFNVSFIDKRRRNSELSVESESFLAPGFHCKSRGESYGFRTPALDPMAETLIEKKMKSLHSPVLFPEAHSRVIAKAEGVQGVDGSIVPNVPVGQKAPIATTEIEVPTVENKDSADVTVNVGEAPGSATFRARRAGDAIRGLAPRHPKARADRSPRRRR